MQQLKLSLTFLVLLVTTLIPSYSNPLPVMPPLPGDVDRNNKVDIVDAMRVAQYTSGITIPGFDSTIADVSGNGTIDITDALLISQYSASLFANLIIVKPVIKSLIGNLILVVGIDFDYSNMGLYFRERTTGISYYYYQRVYSSNRRQIDFTIPSVVNPYCYYDLQPCEAPSKAVVPGTYDVSVTVSDFSGVKKEGSSNLYPLTVMEN